MTGLAGRRVAIANRAEIAARIAATCTRLGMVPVLLAGDPDLNGFAARRIGRVERIGPAGAETDVALVVAAARRAGAELLHPGYGFLSERAELAEGCAAAGIAFVGPSAATLALCGDKVRTRRVAEEVGAPLLGGTPPLGEDPDEWVSAAATVGFPLLVKPAEAGGGRGMRRVADAAGLVEAVSAARREAAASGAGTTVYLERELPEPRHVEVQLIGDGERVLAVGDRDCSLQRRHQKLIEEAPAPGLDGEARRAIHAHAAAIGRGVGLRGVGTCEFLLGQDGTLAFLEVNPRLQVEHPVTELTIGIDLVEWQLRLAAGEGLPDGLPEARGHAIEARVYAEDPARGFLPSPGRLAAAAWPERPGVRVDAGFAAGDEVPAAYDPLLAKVIAHGADRASALSSLRVALGETVVAGVASNVPWLIAAVGHPEMVEGRATTATAARVAAGQPRRDVALAGAVARTLDRPPSADPWTAVGPLRLAGEAGLVFHGDDWEERVAVRSAPGGARVRLGEGADETLLRWWRDRDGAWTVALGEEVARLGFAEHDGALEIAGGEHRWLLREGPRPREMERAGVAADGKVRAPLPGKVLRVEVAVGDRVEAGAPLVTLSAMKIELACESPVGGVVEAVRCAPEELVEAGQVLVEVVVAADGDPSAASVEGES